MSWRLLLAAGYALLVEGLDGDGRAEIDRALGARVAGMSAEELARVEAARERFTLKQVGAEVV
jgi:hypothetical protein